MTKDILDICPACSARRVDRGEAHAPQFPHGVWIGCTACGLTITAPDPELADAAWRAVCRSSSVRDLRQERAAGARSAVEAILAQS